MPKRVYYEETARSSTGSLYRTKSQDGNGAVYYARNSPKPQQVYGEDPSSARERYWTNKANVEEAKKEAKREGGSKALLDSSTFASSFANARTNSKIPEVASWAYMPELDPSTMIPTPFELFQFRGGKKRSRLRSRSRSRSLRGGMKRRSEGEPRSEGRPEPILSLLDINRSRDPRFPRDGDLPFLFSNQRAGVNILSFLGLQETRNLSLGLGDENREIAEDVDSAAKLTVWTEPVIVPIEEVRSYASKYTNITTLIISGSSYTPALEYEIAQAIVSLPKLTKLVFRDYEIRNDFLKTDVLGRAFVSCRSLQILEFDHVKLGDSNILRYLNKTRIWSLAFKGISLQNPLQVLFSDNENGCVGKNLTNLVIVHPQDPRETLPLVIFNLVKLSKLLVFQIIKSYFFPGDIVAFCEMLPNLSIKKLDISFCVFYSQGGVLLAEAMKECKNLESLSLIGNHIGDEGGYAIARALPHCDRLFYLDVRVNNLHFSPEKMEETKKPQLRIEF
jgi:hypothetical protein